jgi:hypothetical protein
MSGHRDLRDELLPVLFLLEAGEVETDPRTNVRRTNGATPPLVKSRGVAADASENAMGQRPTLPRFGDGRVFSGGGR